VFQIQSTNWSSWNSAESDYFKSLNTLGNCREAFYAASVILNRRESALATEVRTRRDGLKGRELTQNERLAVVQEMKCQWYGLRVRSRCEKLVAKDLANKGFEVCSACAPQRRIWIERIRIIEMPLFPGYVFASFDLSRVSEVLTAPGLVSIIGFGNGYFPVDDAEIEALRIMMAAGIEVHRNLEFRTGAKVRVRNGPLEGLEGVLVEIKNQHRLIVSVSLLQRSVGVDVDDVMVELLPAPHGHKTTAAA
jgi:transcription antitermination factor NusG